MTDAAWAALMASLTVVAALWTMRAFRTRGLASGLRGLAITLLPVSAWLTGTLEMFTEIAGSIADWASGLVFNPFVWTGVGLFGTSALLFVVSGRMRTRTLESAARGPSVPGAVTSGDTRASLPPKNSARTSQAPIDDDLADIEELLRKRGIN
jgi:hypothetical protein